MRSMVTIQVTSAATMSPAVTAMAAREAARRRGAAEDVVILGR
jgi:hypothetical protein